MGGTNNTSSTMVTVKVIIANYSNDDIEDISVSASNQDTFELESIFRGKFVSSLQHVEIVGDVKIELFASDSPINVCLHFRNGTADIFYLHKGYVNDNADVLEHVSKAHKINWENSCNFVYKIIINNTPEQFQNIKAAELKTQGEAAMRRKEYEMALGKFSEALCLANNDKLFEDIKKCQNSACKKLGNSLLQIGWNLEETTGRSKEAQNKFEEAKSMLERCEEKLENLEIVNIKIDGNRLFDEANELKVEAEKLFIKAKDSNVEDYEKSKNKYREALNKYKAAKEKFDQGQRKNCVNFQTDSEIVRENIEKVLEAINNFDRISCNNDEVKTKVVNEETVNYQITNLEKEITSEKE